MSNKRRRTDGGASRTGGASRAAAIGARYAAKYPYSQYGTQRREKGSMLDVAGASWAEANPSQRMWRKQNNYYGVGSFRSTVGNFFKKNWKKMAGGALKAFVPGGGAAAKAMGLGRYNFGGLGSYDAEMQNNAIVHGGGSGNGGAMDVATLNPTMDDDSGDVIISHKEFVRNIVVSGQPGKQSPFDLQAFNLNPGLQETFPFLSQMAQNFTMYSMEGLMFQYKPLSGEGGGQSNSLGKVIMSTDYDPQALPFINSVQMENYQYSQSTKPSTGMRHGVECKKSQGTTEMQYVRTGTSTRDKAWTDLGLFQVATEGIPIPGSAGDNLAPSENVIIGELWATYRIRLSRANLYSSLLGYNIKNQIVQLTSVGSSNLVVAGHEIPLIQDPGQTYDFRSNNLDCTVKMYRSRVSGDSIALKIEWPIHTILGTYKITVRHIGIVASSVAGSGRCGVYPTYQELGNAALNYGVPEGQALTQWGSVFLPTAKPAPDGHGLIGENKAGMNAISGTQEWAVIPGSATAEPASQSRTIDDCDSNADLNIITTVTYFAINAPGMNTPRLMMESKAYQTDGSVLTDPFIGVIGNRNVQITIEQVNAEMSN